MSAWDDVMDARGDAMRQLALKRYRAEVLNEAAGELVRRYGVTNRSALDLRRMAKEAKP